MSFETDISIVIPTYNRPAYLRRILDYYSGFGIPFNIIVADSSSDENKVKNSDIVKAKSSLNTRYLGSYPGDIHLHRKVADAVNHVNSKYCVVCADDDFITPDGIRQSVDFLDRNPDYAVAQGRYVGFRVGSDDGVSKRFLWDFTGDLPFSVEHPSPAARLEYHMSNYFASTYYGVHRSDVLKKVFNDVMKSGIDLFPFGELSASMLAIIEGKMKFLRVLYAVRDAQPVTGRTWPNLKDAIEAGTFTAKYAPFRACLAENLSRASGLSIEESGKLVDRAFSAYLQGRSLTPVIPVPKSKKRTALESLHLPQWAQEGIISSYAFTHKLAAVKAQSVYNTVLGKPLFEFKNRDDFRRIRRLVTAQD